MGLCLESQSQCNVVPKKHICPGRLCVGPGGRWEVSYSRWPSSSEVALGTGVQAQKNRAVAGEAMGREGW